MTTQTALQTPVNRYGKWYKVGVLVLLVALYAWAVSGIPFTGIQSTAGEVARSILYGMFHPDWGFVYQPGGEDLLRGLLDTLSIAFLGTLVAAILAVPFAFWSAQNLHKYKTVSGSGKAILSLIRTFPEVVVALLFIKAVGPGSFAGVLALGLHFVGMLGKWFAEAMESIDLGPMEALTASGANRLQALWFAVVPQVMPHFTSLTLYGFEISVRSATILGIIGAGGIGTPLIFALQSRSWSRVGIILLGIIVMVTLIDYLSGFLRKKLV
jgi:phosphonate transport system permease protein